MNSNALLTGALLVAFSLAPSASASGTDVLTQAVKYNDQARALGFEWTVTGKAIKAASTAIQAGDDASELAGKALFLAKASVYQGQSEAELWEDRFPR